MKFLRYILPLLFTFHILFGFSQVSFISDPLPAVGCDSLEVTFTLYNPPPSQPVTSVEWDFGNGTAASGIGPHVIMYDSAGAYTVSILVNGTTRITRNDYVRIYPKPRAAFLWSDSLELGSYTVAMLAPAQQVDSIRYNYQWLVNGAESGDARGIIHTFPDEGEYPVILIVSDPNGCADTAGRRIYVTDVLDCPNVFTPNEDGHNDYFIVSSNGITVYRFQVYSSSGILVYKAEAPIIIWDGRNLSGQELSPGTYFYVIRPSGGSGTFEKKGFVELYR